MRLNLSTKTLIFSSLKGFRRMAEKKAEQRSARGELDTAKNAATSSDTPGNGDRPDIPMRSPIITRTEIAIYLGIIAVIGLVVGLTAPVTAWHVLKTSLAQALTVVGILIIPAAIARLYRSITERRVSWQRSVTLLGFGIVCVCATVVLASIIGLPGQITSKSAGGPPIASSGSSALSTPGMGAVSGVAFGTGDGILADANRDGNVYVWHLGGTQPSYDTLNDAPPGSLGVNSVAFSPNGALLAAGDDNGDIYLWRWALAGKPHTLLSNTNCGGVYGVAFSHDGTLLAAACWNGLVDLWQVSNGSPRGAPLQASTPGVNSVAFSPVGNLLAAGDANGNVYLWSVTSRKLIASLPTTTPSGGVYGVAFSDDGKLLAASSRDGNVYLWQVAGNHVEKLQQLVAPNSTYGLTSLAISPVGNLLAAGDANGSVHVWNLVNRTLTNLADSGGGEVNAVAFSGDGKLLGAGDALGRVRTWHIGS
jgi:WD40 repeat protein